MNTTRNSLDKQIIMQRNEFSLGERASLTTLYSSPDRVYHSLNHVHQCLAVARRWWRDREFLPIEIGETAAIDVELAIWYHDAVYNIWAGAGDNEAESAFLYCRTHLRDHLCLDTGPEGSTFELADLAAEDQVVEAILATAHHIKDQEGLSATARVMLDIDLHGFSTRRGVYVSNSLAIAREFEPVIEEIGQRAFASNRLAFLKKLLERKSIYYCRVDWEKQARENIEWEIVLLEDCVQDGFLGNYTAELFKTSDL